MNWKTSIAAGLLLVSAQVSEVLAGVEPSPFQPEINQLGAVANILNSAEFRIVKTMSAPPEVCVPPDPCKGLYGDVNRLEAIYEQVTSADDMILSIIGEVMGVEPSPFRGDLVVPLEIVLGVADGIVSKIRGFEPTGLVAEEFTMALESVSFATVKLISTVEFGIEEFSQPLECSDFVNEAYCTSAEGCVWYTDPFIDGVCMTEPGH